MSGNSSRLLSCITALCMVSLLSGDEPPLFDPGENPISNRAHTLLYRWDRSASIDDQERLEPLLGRSLPGPASRWLADDMSPQQAIELLDELVHSGERPRHPARRAVLQHDLWVVFLETTGLAERAIVESPAGALRPAAHFLDSGDTHLPRKTERRALQKRLVRAMRQMALSDAELNSLPDNLRLTAESGRYASDFDPEHADQAFLPKDLLDENGPWIMVGSATQPDLFGAPEHFVSSKGRSVFSVLLRLPAGREATRSFIERTGKDKILTEQTLPDLPEGSQTALVRRMVLIDDHGEPRLTSLTESVQLRVFWKDPHGRPFAFKVQRGPLIAGQAASLAPIKLTKRNCISCHARLESSSPTYSIASLFVGERRVGLAPSHDADQSHQSLQWLKRSYSWGLLQAFWEKE